MNPQDINSTYNNLINSLSNNSLGTVFSGIKDLIKDEQFESFSVKLENIEVSYKYMLKYFGQGIDDPKRNEIYNDIAIGLIYILDGIKRKILSDTGTTLFYNKIRYYKMNNLTLKIAIERRKLIVEKIELLKLGENNNISLLNEYKNLENVENDIFSLILIGNQQDKEEISIIDNILKDSQEENYFKELLVSAITLSCLEYFDEDKIALLFHNYNNAGPISIQIKSLIGIYIIQYKYNNIIKFSNKLSELNKELFENKFYNDDIKSILMQFIKSSDTERITKKTHEDLMERINKLGPSIYRKIKGLEVNISDDDENPDWQKMLEESGIDEKVKELSEMQMQGADILMATFSRLKHFSFFQQLVNWFMPFHSNHYLLSQNKSFEKLLNILNKTAFICDSDKFSFLLAANSAPDAEKKMMISQLESQNIELKELALSEVETSQKLREKQIVLYIQNLYRFYKLFNRAKDFENPFKIIPFINKSPIIKANMNNVNLINVAAEFYFKRKYYSTAIDLFNLLLEIDSPTFDIYQKLGLCYQNRENYLKALEMYNKADIINSNNSWTLRHIASCYKSISQIDKALIFYKQAETVDSDNLKLIMTIGNTYLELNKPEEALKYYYKVDYLSKDSEKVIRLIAWCEFLIDNYDRSLSAFNRINNLSAEDYLNLGHLQLAKGLIKEAIQNYRESLNKLNCNVEKFKIEYFNDSNTLLSKGISRNTISIIYDTVLN